MILAPWSQEVCRFPGAEQSSSAGTHQLPLWCTELLALVLKIFSWETATSLQNEGGEGKEQVAEEPRVTGYLSCVLVLEGEGVR